MHPMDLLDLSYRGRQPEGGSRNGDAASIGKLG
jgi:hypothetical protein